MQSLLIVEEDQIKVQDTSIADLQQTLHELKNQAEESEGRIRMGTQDVNEFIFQLEKYGKSQEMLTDEALAAIDKYKIDQANQMLND